MLKIKILLTHLVILSCFVIFTPCFANNVSSITDSTFIRAQAIVQYRVLVTTSTSGEQLTLNSTTSTIAENINFDINSYTITDSVGANSKFIACSSSLNYGVYCTNFTSLPLSSAQQTYLAYLALEQYGVNKALSTFYPAYNYILSPLTQTEQPNPNIVIFTTFPGYIKGQTVTTTREVFVASFPEMISLIQKNVNNVCTDARAKAEYHFYELLGLPPDQPGGDARFFALGQITVTQSADSTTPGVFRPCTSSDITSSTCVAPLNFSSIPAGQENYYKWIAGQYKFAYIDATSHPAAAHYPWTAQGFTYNWFPTSTTSYGVSEYVVAKNTDIYVSDTKTINQMLDENCTGSSGGGGGNSSWTTIAEVAAGMIVAGTGAYMIEKHQSAK